MSKKKELYHTVRHPNDLVEEILDEKEKTETAETPADTVEAKTEEKEAAAPAAEAPAQEPAAADAAASDLEEQVKAAVEDAKKPLEHE